MISSDFACFIWAFSGRANDVIYVFALILFIALLSLSWIDFKTFHLPDILTLPLIALGALQFYLVTDRIVPSLTGAALGYLVFVVVEIAFRQIRGKDGLGRGDAKLLAAGGAWCGWMGLPFIILIASGSGLIAALFPSIRKKSRQHWIAFGPFLAFAIFIVWMSLQISEGYIG